MEEKALVGMTRAESRTVTEEQLACRVGSGTARPLREYIETLRDAIDLALPLGLGKIPYGPQQVMFLQADITQLAADTGFAPRTAFADGIRATIAWAKTQKQTN